MEDVLTELPPPSRFFEEDLNIFIPPSPSPPPPSLSLSEPYNTNETLRPSLLIFAISPPSLHLFHYAASKTLVGILTLPETAPSSATKSCNIHALKLNDTENLVLLVSFEFRVSVERCHAVSKLLLGEKIIPEKVLILDSIQIHRFCGKLSRDFTVAYKLQTSLERKLEECNESLEDGSSILKDVKYYPTGSLVDGLAAALLTRCEIRKIRGSLCVSWPEFGKPVTNLIQSLLVKDVLPQFDFSSTNYDDEDVRKSKWLKDSLLDSDMYT